MKTQITVSTSVRTSWRWRIYWWGPGKKDSTSKICFVWNSQLLVSYKRMKLTLCKKIYSFKRRLVNRSSWKRWKLIVGGSITTINKGDHFKVLDLGSKKRPTSFDWRASFSHNLRLRVSIRINQIKQKIVKKRWEEWNRKIVNVGIDFKIKGKITIYLYVW